MLRSEFDRMLPPSVVLIGVPSHPLPGQDRGPWAPEAIPGLGDVTRGMIVPAEVGPDGRPACWACKGAELKDGYGCGVCCRWSIDRLLPEGERERAEAEVRDVPERVIPARSGMVSVGPG